MKQADGRTQHCRTVSQLQTIPFVSFRTDYLHPWRAGVSWKASLPPRRLVTRCDSFLGFSLLHYFALLLRACVETAGWLRPVLPLLYSISGAELCQGFFGAPRFVLRGASSSVSWIEHHPWWGKLSLAVPGSPSSVSLGAPPLLCAPLRSVCTT